MGKHSKLSASASHRWLTCTPSAKLEQQFPNEESAYATEGTFAHTLAELRLSRVIVNATKPSAYEKKLTKLKKDPLYTKSLEEYVEQYVSQVAERYLALVNNCGDTLALLEEKLDYSQWAPGGYGTGDVVLIADNVLEVIDLKYGKGVPVSAENNPQTRLYGLGAISAYGMLYDFSIVRMTIIQPRLDSISTEEMAVDELLEWAETYVKPKATQANKGEGEYTAGDHCRFCRARHTCRARAEKNLAMAKYDFQEPELLTDEEIGEILFKAEALQKWAKDISEYAFDQANNHGVRYAGWKLVEGRSNRKYTNEAEVAEALIKAGYNKTEIYKPQELVGITAMEQVTGKNIFKQLLSDLVIKPTGKPVLVPETDKRPEINSAQEDFLD